MAESESQIAPTTHYLVRWEIDVDADSPEDAAEQASAFLHGADTTATVFEVLNPDASTCHVCRDHRIALIDLETLAPYEGDDQ